MSDVTPTNVEMEEKAIVNIKRIEIITEEVTPRKLVFDTASEATYSPTVNEGAETVLRTKNRIIASDRTEDIQYGSDITLKEVVMLPDVLCIVDGGTLKTTVTGSGESQITTIKGYTPPVLGSPVERVKFSINIYTEEKDTDGEVLGYSVFKYPGCKGKPVNFAFKDGEFMTPEYTIVSRPKKGTAPYELDFIKELPA